MFLFFSSEISQVLIYQAPWGQFLKDLMESSILSVVIKPVKLFPLVFNFAVNVADLLFSQEISWFH
jgi:hypothetical protein